MTIEQLFQPQVESQSAPGEVKTFVGAIPAGYAEVTNTLENTVGFKKIGTYANQILQNCDKLDGFVPFRALDSNPNGITGLFITPVDNADFQIDVGFINMDFLANPINFYNVYASGFKKKTGESVQFTNFLDTILANALITTASQTGVITKLDTNVNGIQPWYVNRPTQIGINDTWAFKDGDTVWMGGNNMYGANFGTKITLDQAGVGTVVNGFTPNYSIFSKEGVHCTVGDYILGWSFDSTQAKFFRRFNNFTVSEDQTAVQPNLSAQDKLYIVRNPVQTFVVGGKLYWLGEDGYIYAATENVVGTTQVNGETLTEYEVRQVCLAEFQGVGYVNYYERPGTDMVTKLVGFKFDRVLTEIPIVRPEDGQPHVLNYNSYTLYDLSNIEQVVAMTKKIAIKL